MTLRLVTIPFSHYCEKARWALDRAGVAYEEEPHLPMISWLPALRAGGRRTVPVAVTPDGPVADSTDIMHWCDVHGRAAPLFPDDLPDAGLLEDALDRRYGPATRLVAYAAVLPSKAAASSLFDAVPGWEGKVVGASFPLVRGVMARLLKLEPATVARARARIDETFASIAQRLSDGRRYLAGDRFTGADLAFAALSAPILAPAQYGGPLPPRAVWPADFAAYVDARRATAAGQFALRIYADERAPAAR